MRKTFLFLLIFLCPSLLLGGVLGCSTFKSPLRRLGLEVKNPGLKKRVMVLPIVDQAGLGWKKTAQINARFLELLKQSPHLLASRTPAAMLLPSRTSSTDMEILTRHKMVQQVGAMGMNAMITGTVTPVEATTEKKGFWPFRKFRKTYELSMVINVFDSVSRALLLTLLQSEKVSFPLEETQDQGDKIFLDEIASKALPRVLKRQASSAIKTLVRAPWTGKVLEVSDGTVKINAGKDVGVRPGHIFEVFTRGESIHSRSGQSFDLLGKKIGEIKVDAVMEKQALAKPLAGAPFSAGQIIRFKP